MKCKEHIFSQIKESSPLPSLPHILVKLINVCDDDTIPIQEIAPLVTIDTSLSSKVLRLVNSAYFGLNRTFSNLDQAVVYLGTSTIKNLAIIASVQQVFGGIKKKKSSFQPGIFWYRSLLSATLGKRIGQHINYTNTEEAYLAGLLHNIGQLVIYASFSDKAEQITQNIHNHDLCEKETDLIGITHCEAGAWLLKQWKISPFIADAALYHHHGVDQIREAFPLVRITSLASKLSEVRDDDFTNILPFAQELFDIDEPTITDLLADAREEIEEIATCLEVDIHLPATSNTTKATVEDHKTISEKSEELSTAVQNESLLTGFFRKLLKTEGRENILATTEEIIHILFGSNHVFFLLFDNESKNLLGCSSLTNALHDTIKDIFLPCSNTSSQVFTALKEQTILSPFTNPPQQPTNLADVQLFKLVNSSNISYVPLLAQQSEIGIIILDFKDPSTLLETEKLNQLRLIADQTALSLYLEKLQRQEAEKLQSERMATASLAAKKIVHEVNNPLGIISNYLKLLEIKLSEDSSIQAELKILDEEIDRISAIISKLNDFAAPSGFETAPVNLNRLIGNMLRILLPALLEPAEIQLHYKPDSNLQNIHSDKDTIKQILLNLIKNAVEALINGGAITIATSNLVEDDEISGVNIAIHDNGPGIPDHVKEKLFSPFISTKNYGHSGLGLSIVHRAVEDLGGSITCESLPEQGTQFSISLPLKPPSLAYTSEV